MAKLQFSPDKVEADAEAESRISQIVDGVAADPEGRFLLTKNGDPSVVIVNVKYIESLLGDNVTTPPTAPLPPQAPLPEPQITPPPGLPIPPSPADFIPAVVSQPQPPQEVQQKPPLQPPAATDFQPLISPLGASPSGPNPPGMPPSENPISPPSIPGNPLIPPPPPPSGIQQNNPPPNPGSIPPTTPFLGPQ